jgi:hypothetical protein
MVEITYQIVLSTIQTIALIVGIIYYITIMRKTRKERKNQLVDQTLQSYGRTETAELWIRTVNQVFSSYEEWYEKYGPSSNPEAAKYMYTMWGYYNALGNNLRDGHIDADYVLKNTMLLPVIALWERSKVIFEVWRERHNWPSMYAGFEYLYNIVRKEYPDVTYAPAPLRNEEGQT